MQPLCHPHMPHWMALARARASLGVGLLDSRCPANRHQTMSISAAISASAAPAGSGYRAGRDGPGFCYA
jgi:hypothetical protein